MIYKDRKLIGVELVIIHNNIKLTMLFYDFGYKVAALLKDIRFLCFKDCGLHWD